MEDIRERGGEVNGTFKGITPEIDEYATLTACLDMMAGMRHQLSRGTRGIVAEVGCEHSFDVFIKHEENIRAMMHRIRYGATGVGQTRPAGAYLHPDGRQLHIRGAGRGRG